MSVLYRFLVIATPTYNLSSNGHDGYKNIFGVYPTKKASMKAIKSSLNRSDQVLSFDIVDLQENKVQVLDLCWYKPEDEGHFDVIEYTNMSQEAKSEITLKQVFAALPKSQVWNPKIDCQVAA